MSLRALEALVFKCLEKQREARYDSEATSR
jgi:hypothetical protein